jgi:uncharacterized membrane protein YjjB (DUF3815 family)
VHPSVSLVVPGNIRFRCLFNVHARDVISGVETTLRVGIVGISIVAGLTAGNALVRPRKLGRLDA